MLSPAGTVYKFYFRSKPSHARLDGKSDHKIDFAGQMVKKEGISWGNTSSTVKAIAMLLFNPWLILF
jgi:hypothetical protein